MPPLQVMLPLVPPTPNRTRSQEKVMVMSNSQRRTLTRLELWQPMLMYTRSTRSQRRRMTTDEDDENEEEEDEEDAEADEYLNKYINKHSKVRSGSGGSTGSQLSSGSQLV